MAQTRVKEMTHLDAVLEEVGYERERQDMRWGEQNHIDAAGMGDYDLVKSALEARAVNQKLIQNKTMSWAAILGEEVAEAFDEINEDEVALRADLVQVAAVCVAWIQAIDRRNSK